MKRILTILLCVFAICSQAAVFNSVEERALKKHFLENIQANGAIVASPSKQNPDYYYDWVRDSAIAMDLIASWYEHEPSAERKTRLLRYVQWVEQAQHQRSPWPDHDILGEPKFYVDGRVYDGPWGRPQNDGPALRAIALTRFADGLLNQGEQDYVRAHLYGGGLDPKAMGAIKIDLEYVAHHWQDPNFDLWEEVYGHHFFTSMVQRKALLAGARLARTLNEPGAAVFYEQQAKQIEARLAQHIDYEHSVIQATLAPHQGPQKTLELDSAVILGVLLGSDHDGLFAANNYYVRHTAKALKKEFKASFPINDQYPDEILYGRYPGDLYDGYRTDGAGNPWFILTATMAEYYYTLAHELRFQNIAQAKRYLEKGDGYLKLVKEYAKDLRMKEQINLNTGEQQGADSLTWSYVATLRAIQMRGMLSKSSF